MKALAKGAFITLLVLALLIAVPVAYSTARGYTQWWIKSGGEVLVDGVPNGYLHSNWSHSAVMITRTDSKRDQTYLVTITGTEFSLQ